MAHEFSHESIEASKIMRTFGLWRRSSRLQLDTKRWSMRGKQQSSVQGFVLHGDNGPLVLRTVNLRHLCPAAAMLDGMNDLSVSLTGMIWAFHFAAWSAVSCSL